MIREMHEKEEGCRMFLFMVKEALSLWSITLLSRSELVMTLHILI